MRHPFLIETFRSTKYYSLNKIDFDTLSICVQNRAGLSSGSFDVWEGLIAETENDAQVIMGIPGGMRVAIMRIPEWYMMCEWCECASASST